MIAHVHEGTMKSDSLISLASHGHRRTRSAAPGRATFENGGVRGIYLGKVAASG